MRRLFLRFHGDGALEARAPHVQVVIVELGTIPRIRTETETGADVLLLVFRHAHHQRQLGRGAPVDGLGHGGGALGLGRLAFLARLDLFVEDAAHVGAHFHAGKIARVLQARLERLQRRFAVVVARTDLVQVADDAGIVALQAFDAQFAEAQLGAAVEHHQQGDLVRFRIDHGLRIDQLGTRIARLHHFAQQGALGRFPFGLAEHAARLQGPVALQRFRIVGLAGGQRRRGVEAAQFQLDLVDRHRLAGIDVDDDDGPGACRIDAHGDNGRVIAGRGHQILRLFRGVAHEALQLLAVHARIAAEAFQVKVLFKQLIEVAGGVHLDLVLQRGRCRLGAGRVVRSGVLRGLLGVGVGDGEDQDDAAGGRQCQLTHYFYHHLCQNSWS